MHKLRSQCNGPQRPDWFYGKVTYKLFHLNTAIAYMKKWTNNVIIFYYLLSCKLLVIWTFSKLQIHTSMSEIVIKEASEYYFCTKCTSLPDMTYLASSCYIVSGFSTTPLVKIHDIILYSKHSQAIAKDFPEKISKLWELFLFCLLVPSWLSNNGL